MRNRNTLMAALILLIAALACSMPGVSEPVVDATKIALEIQSTQMSLQMTQSALSKQEQPVIPQATEAAPAIDGTKIALEVQSTQMSLQMTQSANEAQAQPESNTQPTDIAPAPQQDMQSRIKDAKILVYEDAGGANLRPWVQETLDLMGLKHTYVRDRIGDFMSHLNSGTQWDLIIVAAESRSGVQGEFWDIITPKVTGSEKTALIVEMWYLSDIANGRIQGLTAKCGIKFQKVRTQVESIYTLDGSNPIFTTPNSGFSLTNYSTQWFDKGGDYVRLTGGDASLVAGGFPKEKSSYGLLTTCMDGRVVIQTFSSHDYRHEVMLQLWENYIVNTLTNHFNALEQ